MSLEPNPPDSHAGTAAEPAAEPTGGQGAASGTGPDAAGPVASDLDGGFRRLAPAALTLWRLNALFWGLAFTASAAVVEFVATTPWPTGLLAFAWGLLSLIWVVMVPPMRYRAWRYRLREDDLYLTHGILFRTTSIIPHVRIQHVDTRHGPLDRWLGLSEVVVYTAGTRGAIIPIPALAADTAESLRDTLATLSGAGDAV